MSRDRIRPAFAAASAAVLAAAALSFVAAGAAQAGPRPGAEHLWKGHLKKQARAVFATREGVKKRIANAIATPVPDDPPTSPPTTTPTPAPAADPNDDDGLGAALFGWADKGGVKGNALEGLGYALLGFLGALVTAFFYVHDFLPSVGGTAEYLSVRERVADLKERREKVRAAREKYALSADEKLAPERLEELNRLDDDHTRDIEHDETWMRKERVRIYRASFPMYLVLGSAFAVLFATNPLQGLLIGFGWTAIADRAGLKRQVAERQEKRDEKIEEIERVATEQVLTASAKEQQALKEKAQAELEMQADREKARMGEQLAAGRIDPEQFTARAQEVTQAAETTSYPAGGTAAAEKPAEAPAVAQIRTAARQARAL